ncbi:MAG: hypothetical protein DRN12_05265 [Thermoplasmata archaeon]|nr:MAG: hypothetical protein DRN12_05265 [Thermoplasmata archaeon]
MKYVSPGWILYKHTVARIMNDMYYGEVFTLKEPRTLIDSAKLFSNVWFHTNMKVRYKTYKVKASKKYGLCYDKKRVDNWYKNMINNTNWFRFKKAVWYDAFIVLMLLRVCGVI